MPILWSVSRRICAAAAVAALLSGCGRETAPAKPPAQPTGADVERAFETLYGRPDWAVERIDNACKGFVHRPVWLYPVEDQDALVVTSNPLVDADGCYASTSIHYLRHVGGKYRIVRSWVHALRGMSRGMGVDLRPNDEMFTHWALESRGGEEGPGYASHTLELVELMPKGPIVRLKMRSFCRNGPRPVPDFQAFIQPGERDRSIRLRYLIEVAEGDGDPLDQIEDRLLVRDGALYRPADPRQPLYEDC
jgi:hypothetical protein